MLPWCFFFLFLFFLNICFIYKKKQHIVADEEYFITETYLYNFEPFKPNFYIVKLGFTGYTLFFLFLLKNIDCGYL